jgi:hypothetical protein
MKLITSKPSLKSQSFKIDLKILQPTEFENYNYFICLFQEIFRKYEFFFLLNVQASSEGY